MSDSERTDLKPGEFFGTITRAAESASVRLSETTYGPSVDVPYHVHRGAYFCFVVAGHFREMLNRSTVRECVRSHLIFHPPGEVHADIFGRSGGRCLNIELDGRWSDAIGCAGILRTGAVIVNDTRCAVAAMALRREMYTPDEMTPFAIEGQVLALLTTVARRGPTRSERTPQWLRRSISRIRAEYHTSLTVAELAGEVHIHPVHFGRVFQKHSGYTVHGFIASLRVKEACDLIDDGMSLAQVAATTGFADQSHLCRTFRRFMGLAPAEYRKQFGKATADLNRSNLLHPF